jgi:cation transport protein ChaC
MSDVWIFGYGSLIWNPNFSFVQSRIGYLKGWCRRFYQGSPDHRGTPHFPGRVVTLVPSTNSVVWGKAYKIDQNLRNETLQRLDHREKAGYRFCTDVMFSDAEKQIEVSFYIAEEGNPDWLGAASPEDIVAHIIGSCGPSGTNSEYLLNLARSLKEMNVRDEHVTELETLLNQRLATINQ